MNRFRLFMLMCIVAITATAQTVPSHEITCNFIKQDKHVSVQSRPLVCDNKKWHVMRYSERQLMFGNYSKGAAEEYDLCFTQSNDTVINGQSYHNFD